MKTVRITGDTEEFNDLVDELTELVTDAGCSPGLRQFLVGLFELPSELIHVHQERIPTGGTYELRVRLQPTPVLHDLMAAARAGDIEAHLVDHFGFSPGDC